MADFNYIVTPQTDISTTAASAGGSIAVGNLEVIFDDDTPMTDLVVMFEKAKAIAMQRYTAKSRD